MTARALPTAIVLLVLLALPVTADAAAGHVQQSRGALNAGRLENASRLRNSKYIVLRFPKNAWGSRRLVDLIQGCAKQVRRRHKRAHKLMVGDLSRRRGGTMRPHSGHQNGREADLGFYMRSGKYMPGLWRVGPSHIDAPRTLTFLQCLIGSGDVLRIFLDRGLQAPLYKEAKKRGWSVDRLGRTFSYPRRRRARVGLIQHRRRHDNHLHLRIRCAPHERRCQDRPAGVGRRPARKKTRTRKNRP